MKGLIINDLYSMLKNFKAYLLIFVVFAIIIISGSGNVFMAFYMMFFAATIPLNVMGIEENSKWNVYCCTFPCTRSQIVLTKYIIGLFSEIIAGIISGICYAAGLYIEGAFDAGVFLLVIASSIVVSFIYMSLTLPFLFKFGAEKGRIVSFVMMGVVCGVFVSIGFIGSGDGTLLGNLSQMYFKKENMWIIYAAFALVLAIYALSYGISSKIYKKREIV